MIERGGRQTESRRDYFPVIDVVRFFAALSVALFHLGYMPWLQNQSTSWVSALAAPSTMAFPYAWAGWVGVEIFFVVSGFVIAASAIHAAPIHFGKGRILRLYPAVWFCGSVSAVTALCLHLFDTPQIASYWIRTMLLLPAGGWIEPIYWTIGVEMAFYGLVFLLIVARRAHQLEGLAWALLASSSLYLIISWVTDFDEGAYRSLFRLLLLRHGCFFALGIFLWARSRRAPTPILMLGTGLAIAACCLEIVWKTTEDVRWDPSAFTEPGAWLPVGFWLVCIGVIWIFTGWNRRARRVNPAVLSAFKRAGLMTYPLYLIHESVGGLTSRTLLAAQVPSVVAVVIGVTMALLAAYAICRFIEPVVRLGLKLLLDRLQASWFSRVPQAN